MKLAAVLLLLAAALARAEFPPLLVKNGEPVFASEIKDSLPESWGKRGQWQATDGVIRGSGGKKSSLFALFTPDGPMVVECELRLKRGHSVVIGAGNIDRMTGGMVISPQGVRLCEGSPGITLGAERVVADAMPRFHWEEWEPVRVEYVGDQMSAQIGQIKIQGEHPFFGAKKLCWFVGALPKSQVEIRNLRVSKGVPLKP